jgi:hypothetical protein
VVCTRTPLQLRYHTHGGLTPAALVNVRSCIAKIVFASHRRFFATNVRTATRAGGVSPPWVRTASAPAFVTPAALGCVFAGPRTLLDSRRTAFSFPYHSGLTKAAPGSAGVAASCLACGRFGRKMCQSPRAHRHKEHQKRAWKGSRNSMRAICAPTQRTPEADLERFTQLYETKNSAHWHKEDQGGSARNGPRRPKTAQEDQSGPGCNPQEDS